jgi:integrase
MSGKIRRKTLQNGSVRFYAAVMHEGREVALGSFKTKRNAETAVRRAEAEVAAGTFGKREARSPTFNEFFERWIASKHNLRESTLVSYKHTFKNHILPTFGDMRLDEIGPLDVQAWIDDLAESDLTPGTVAKCFRYFRAAMKQAEAWEMIDRAPTVKINLPRSDSEEMTFLEYGEISRLLDAAEEPTRTLFAVLAYSGLRLGEALALRWRDIDLEVGRIRVARSWGYLGGFTEPKTRTSKRNVPLLPVLEKVLTEYRERNQASGPDDLLFTFDGKKPLDPANVRKKFLKALGEVGLGHCTIHSLRHSYASLMLSCGTSVKALQVALGHASATMTLDTYSHLLETDMDGPVARASAVIEGIRELERDTSFLEE